MPTKLYLVGLLCVSLSSSLGSPIFNTASASASLSTVDLHRTPSSLLYRPSPSSHHSHSRSHLHHRHHDTASHRRERGRSHQILPLDSASSFESGESEAEAEAVVDEIERIQTQLEEIQIGLELNQIEKKLQRERDQMEVSDNGDFDRNQSDEEIDTHQEIEPSHQIHRHHHRRHLRHLRGVSSPPQRLVQPESSPSSYSSPSFRANLHPAVLRAFEGEIHLIEQLLRHNCIAIDSECNVEIVIPMFSGRVNPHWKIEPQQVGTLVYQMTEIIKPRSSYPSSPSHDVLHSPSLPYFNTSLVEASWDFGYHGFCVEYQVNGFPTRVDLVGNPQIEHLLLETGRQYFADQKSRAAVDSADGTDASDGYLARDFESAVDGIESSFGQLARARTGLSNADGPSTDSVDEGGSVNGSNDALCRTPQRGSSAAPCFQDSTSSSGCTDVFGCFVSPNFFDWSNCYAYGYDIFISKGKHLTPQPGVAAGIPVMPAQEINCENTYVRVMNDCPSLQLIDGHGTTGSFPLQPISGPGHYVTMLVIDGIDYHFMRQDSDGFFSGKGGWGGKPIKYSVKDPRYAAIPLGMNGNYHYCATFIVNPQDLSCRMSAVGA